MPAPQNLRATGDRIERLLDELQARADPRSNDLAGELLRSITELYGAGLARMVELAGDVAPDLLDDFAADDLVASLLVVHGLHPEALASRVEHALVQVRPFLASHAGDVELLGVDAASGAVRLRLLGNCDGCPSSAVTLQMAVERAILEAAPEVVRVEVEQRDHAGADASAGHPRRPLPSVPVAMSVKRVHDRPVYDKCPAGVGNA